MVVNHLSQLLELESFPEYDCSIFKGSTTTPHPIIGYSLIIIGVPTLVILCFFLIQFQFFYIICLIVIMQKKLRQRTCYKIMFYLGIVDMGAICVNCLETGMLYIQGAYFCTYPRMIYLTGAIGLSLWCCSCFTCFVLVINRLYNLWHASAATQIRHPDPVWRAGVCLLLPTIYCIYFFYFTTPPIFNSAKSSWFFDPDIPGISGFKYENYSHLINNLSIVTLSSIGYVVFIILLRAKYKRYEQKFSFKANPIVLQAILMCFFNFIAAIIYVYMQYFPMWPPLIIIGQYCWVAGHACPPYLYFYLNPTIRRRIKRFFGCGIRIVPRTYLPPRIIPGSRVEQENKTDNKK